MDNKEKWEELTKKGIIICNNWKRGCWNEINDGFKRCISCREKERIADKNLRNKKKNESNEYNKNNTDNKMCIDCSKIVSNNLFNIEYNKCTLCCNKNKEITKTRNPRDKAKGKLYDYKRSARKRGLVFELTDDETLKLVQSSCNYCGIYDMEIILGIDRIDSNLGYTKKNTVPCCEQCNLMKHLRSYTDFINICEHIVSVNELYEGNIDNSLFTIAKTQRYCNYKYDASRRDIEFNLSKNEFSYLVLQKCIYCHSEGEGYYGMGAGGIDRINSTKDYNINNCVPCCSTCNIMKLNYTKESFLNKCLQITKHMNNNKKLEEEIIEFFNKYSNNKEGVKRYNPTFFHSHDFYEHRKWNGTFEDLNNIDIELEFVENSDQKDLWNYYRWNISSLNTFKPNNFIGRVICILIKDKKINKYLGIMSLSSDILNMSDRDKAIGWSQEEKINNKKINFISNLSTCVSIQPFGFNYNGGKLIAMLAFSKEVMDKYEEKFNNKLLAIVTTGLHGKSVQYDRLKELKQVGMTKGNSIFWIPEEITKKCRQYMKNVHNINTTNYKKLEVIVRIISLLGLDKEELLSSNMKSIYLGFTRPNSQKYLSGESNKINDYTFKTAKEIFNEWLNRWAIQRFLHLTDTNRYIKKIVVVSTEKAKRYHEKLKKDLGEEKFKEFIKIKNQKTYNNKKEQITNSSIIKNIEIKSTEKAKRYREKLKEELGEEKFKEYIKIKNQKSYTKRKEQIMNSNIIQQEPTKNKEIKSTEKAKRYHEKLKEELGEYIKIKNQKSYTKRKEKLREKSTEKFTEKSTEKVIEKPNIKENKKESDNIIINGNSIIKPDLPNNISLYRENDGIIYIQFNKSIKAKRHNMKHKITTNNIQFELDKLIDNVNIKFADLQIPKYIITNQDIWNKNQEIINYIKEINTSNKPIMPKNFSICNVNDIDYIQFCKKINNKRCQYKTRINMHNLQEELNKFIDYLNDKYDFKLVKEDYIINNPNNIINHTETK
jgi:hypothetical protein